eukprot:jgi/Chrzof1/9059/Cz03g34170.t1
MGFLDPDHPLLQRAQQALKQQLESKKLRVEGELREKQNVLTHAKKQRETVGVELYGYQQNLAKLQLALEKTQDNYQAISRIRVQAEQDLATMRQRLASEDNMTKQERQKAEQVQRELDRLGSTLKQIESYNEQMKGEIAVTRRAAYAAEEAVQKLEKEKIRQDYLIDDLQETMKSLHQQHALYSAQLVSQQKETRAAQETLAEAEADMQGVHFEKKQLVAQWKSSLNAIQKRDEALAAIQDAMREQQQQELSLDTEIQGFKKDITKEQLRNEQLTAVVRKVEGESDFVSKQISIMVEKQDRLSDQLEKLSKSLEQTEDRLKRANLEAKAVIQEAEHVDRAIAKAFQDVRSLEGDMVKTLSEQTTAEKSSSKTAADINSLRQRSQQEELRIAEAQNELAKIQVDILNTESHNERLLEALKILEGELTDKEGAISKYEAEIKRRGDEIERKTREIDQLNRKLERMIAAQPEAVNTGPLEATINSLTKEIELKGVEGKELQRRWIARQTELVALQIENNKLAEALARRKAEHTVLTQKRHRLEQQLNHQAKEAKSLNLAATRLHVDLQRINALIADHATLRMALEEENLQLQGRATNELRDMEEEAARLQSSIEEGVRQKRDILADIVETERQIMLWERKIELEKEMQEMLDPTVGEGVVQNMRKEIHRMELRHAELLRTQEQLMQELERALSKHEIIGVKSIAQQSSKSSSAHVSESQMKKAVGDLQRSIRDTEKEISCTEARMQEMSSERENVNNQLQQLASSCQALAQEHETMREELADASKQRYCALLSTARYQRIAKKYEELETGRYRAQVEDPSQLDAELSRASDKQLKLVNALQSLHQRAPALHEDVERILAHAIAVQ